MNINDSISLNTNAKGLEKSDKSTKNNNESPVLNLFEKSEKRTENSNESPILNSFKKSDKSSKKDNNIPSNPNSQKVDPAVKKRKEQIGNLKASNGMTYKAAKAKIREIQNKYKSEDDGCYGMFSNKKNPYLKAVMDEPLKHPSRDGVYLGLTRFHYELDDSKIPEPDKSEYKNAQDAIREIEENSSMFAGQSKMAISLITWDI